MLAFALRSPLAVSRSAAACLTATAALSGWTAASLAWSSSVPRTMLELQRDLAYLGAVSCVVLLLGRERRFTLVRGVAVGAAAVALYGLGEYLLAAPAIDQFQGYLLFRPVGYANGLGALIAIALPVVLGLAAHGPTRLTRCAALGAVVPFACALYLTQSRAAWLGLAVGLVVWVSRTNAPGRAVAVIAAAGVPAAASIALVWMLDLLDADTPPADRGTRAGIVAAAVVALGVAAAALARSARRFELPRARAKPMVLAGAAVIAVATAVSLTHLGDRSLYWRVAWEMFERRPLFGTGAGTFESYWLELRELDVGVRDAHNLYLETAAELGLVGLALLVALLTVPIVSARAERDPLVTSALGGYSVFLVHAAFEWDWELPVVTLSALGLGCALSLSREDAVVVQRAPRAAVTAVAAALAALSAVGLTGQTFLATAERRAAAGSYDDAALAARRATRFLPWSAQAWLIRGGVHARLGEVEAARDAYLQGLRRDDRDWRLWYELSLVTRGDERQAAFRKAVALNPVLFAR
jgi:O-antigen ligase